MFTKGTVCQCDQAGVYLVQSALSEYKGSRKCHVLRTNVIVKFCCEALHMNYTLGELKCFPAHAFAGFDRMLYSALLS